MKSTTEDKRGLPDKTITQKLANPKAFLRELTLNQLDELHQELDSPRHRGFRELVGQVVLEKVQEQVEERRERNGFYD